MIKLQKIMAEEKSPDAQSLLLNIVSNSRRLDLKKVYDPPPPTLNDLLKCLTRVIPVIATGSSTTTVWWCSRRG
jgi:hypothetical protein